MKIMRFHSTIPRWRKAPVLDRLQSYRRMRRQYVKDALQQNSLEPRLAEETLRRNRMKWEKPAASDMRFGFEITMYIANR